MRMKKLTLDINERQEQEDYQGTPPGPVEARQENQNLVLMRPLFDFNKMFH